MALTNVMEQFSIRAPVAQWLTTGYLLTLAILVPISALLMKWFTNISDRRTCYHAGGGSFSNDFPRCIGNRPDHPSCQNRYFNSGHDDWFC
ncbi:hypothetical protein [Neobacillus mesonae]|uniref:hypothetical protein n=1 Tax=Neobacillus mesonae TaxID=1193713 RepID=UPI00203C8AE1|nr:hypothetical protein [Neobacillus mesonae]MCM3567251.1 hypothetical protein [Neobacillus mesonae]